VFLQKKYNQNLQKLNKKVINIRSKI